MRFTDLLLEERHTDEIHEAVEAFRRDGGVLHASVFSIERGAARPRCITESGDFPLEASRRRLGAKPSRAMLMDRDGRFLLVYFFHADQVDAAGLEQHAIVAATRIGGVLDEVMDPPFFPRRYRRGDRGYARSAHE